jgi:hypothetical protein
VAQHKTAVKMGGTRRSSIKSMKKAGGAEKASGDAEVSLDRRRGTRRDGPDASETAEKSGPQLERRKKVNRRRQIDPTTCERDYSEQEVEFMNALDDYKRRSGRMFPTCSEVLEVLRSLGYVKLSAAELGAMPGDSMVAASAKPMPSDWPVLTATSDSCDDAEAESDLEPQLAF